MKEKDKFKKLAALEFDLLFFYKRRATLDKHIDSIIKKIKALEGRID